MWTWGSPVMNGMVIPVVVKQLIFDSAHFYYFLHDICKYSIIMKNV